MLSFCLKQFFFEEVQLLHLPFGNPILNQHE